MPLIPPVVMRWLAAIPDLIRIGRKVHKAATEPDEEKVHPNAWTYKDTEHVRGQIASATSHKVRPAHEKEESRPQTPEKRTLDPNPYIIEPDPKTKRKDDTG